MPTPANYYYYYYYYYYIYIVHILDLNLKSSYQIVSLFDVYIDINKKITKKPNRPSH